MGQAGFLGMPGAILKRCRLCDGGDGVLSLTLCRSKHHFGRSQKKGRCIKPNGAAAAWWERAPTLPDNAIVREDASLSVCGMDSNHMSHASTDDIINGGAREMASPDSVHLADYDCVDAIGNR
ncbi:hypothetical protein HPB50_009620 [Hyalomma asiaticum]|uniref:Uncharacterized protein n=1 Tax=Hyalomma asiaticum TaxID=266040 RepID=A0ACB7SUD5_HYAAI|nr:hypothetical protein HPB50_009620 [Hyalomma asiaticum]